MCFFVALLLRAIFRLCRPFLTRLAAKESAVVLCNLGRFLTLAIDRTLEMIDCAQLLMEKVGWLVAASEAVTQNYTPSGTPLAGTADRSTNNPGADRQAETIAEGVEVAPKSDGADGSDGSDSTSGIGGKAATDTSPCRPGPPAERNRPSPLDFSASTPRRTPPPSDHGTPSSPTSPLPAFIPAFHKNNSPPSPDTPQDTPRYTPMAPRIAEAMELELGLLDEVILNNRLLEFFDPENKQVITSGEFVQQCTRLVLVATLHPEVYPRPKYDEDVSNAGSATSSNAAVDEIMTATDAKRLLACVARAPTGFESVTIAVCTVVCASVVELYREKLEMNSNIESGLFISVSLLQNLFSGGVSEPSAVTLRSSLLSSGGNQILRPELPFLAPGGSIAALVMHLASRQWYFALGTRGIAAVNHLAQGGFKSLAIRKRDLSQICDWARNFTAERDARAQRYTVGSAAPASELDDSNAREEIASAESRSRVAAISAWQRVIALVTNDRGIWSSAEIGDGTAHTFWKLDDVEDLSRCRRRLVRNMDGSSRPEATLDTTDSEDPSKTKGKLDALDNQWLQGVQGSLGLKLNIATANSRQRRESVDLDDSNELEASIVSLNPNDGSELVDARASGYDARAGTFDARGSSMTNDHGGPVEEVMALSSKLLLQNACVIITPNEKVDATVYVSRREFCISVDESAPLYRNGSNEKRTWLDTLNGRWFTSEIVSVAQRRYILQHTAIEVFFSDHKSVMIHFPNDGSTKGTDIQKKAMQSISISNRSAEFLFGIGPLLRSNRSADVLLKRSDATSRWLSGELCNFDYLQLLNTFAGRTFHDLVQYPVFPWILSDYSSATLNLDDPSVYRDLSKPIGALNAPRLEQILERYESWDEEMMQTPPCHYGSMYSTPGYVLFWLVRLEPFSGMFVDLQGGTFDHPDRTFFSIEQAWKNCQISTSDVKELIPELFYLPEMLVNSNQFDFGTLQDIDQVIGDVELPPWATSPEDFVRKHRAALESPYVTQHLNEWIDLIFGHKQRGSKAVDAHNTFYHLCYEGNCNIDAIDDQVLRDAAEAQIQNFGQVPIQLFHQPHPQRQTMPIPWPIETMPTASTASSSDKDTIALADITPESPVTFLSILGDELITISCNQCVWVHKLSDQGLVPDPLLENAAEASRRQLGEPFDQKTIISPACFGVLPDHRSVFVGGYWDNSLKVFGNDGHHIDSLFSHVSVLSCVAASPNGQVIVTGSRDTTVAVWPYTAPRFVATEMLRNVATEIRKFNLRSPVRVSDAPTAILVGHEQSVTCVCVNAGLDTVVSGSLDLCLVHKLSGDLVRVIHHPTAKKIHLVALVSFFFVSVVVVVALGLRPRGCTRGLFRSLRSRGSIRCRG